MNTDTWSDNAEENAAVEAMYRMVAEMAAVLNGFDDARFADPSGGYRVG
ncbi:MAG: hypothetical protein HOQ36_03635 [Nocardia sp.]|nr:hypothetical protein [Nocardia sp.]NUS91493.1 hypothetical protein [Nocardia sp.]